MLMYFLINPMSLLYNNNYYLAIVIFKFLKFFYFLQMKP
ncbi:hypothetical protein AC7_A0047 [Clostridium perfringens NCTC 8239]|nr:hypothetical protein AC7_A0047 [Clostridium perfringens NCTC 8239]